MPCRCAGMTASTRSPLAGGAPSRGHTKASTEKWRPTASGGVEKKSTCRDDSIRLRASLRAASAHPSADADTGANVSSAASTTPYRTRLLLRRVRAADQRIGVLVGDALGDVGRQ